MNKLSTDRQAAILNALVEGNSIRATARMVGVSKNTVSRFLRIAGGYAMHVHDGTVRAVEPKRVQCDEIWTFVGCEERNVPAGDKGQGRGDVWTWTALDQDSKLMISYRVGNRDAETALAFMDDLRARVSKRFQLTTDGLSVYLRAVETHRLRDAGQDLRQQPG
jgi:IS1 family transposase